MCRASPAPVGLVRLAVLLDARGPQARQSVTVYGTLPAQELFDRQRVALAGLLEAQQAAANSGHHLGLAAYHPALGICRRQIGHREGAAVRANHVGYAPSEGFDHATLFRTHLPPPDANWPLLSTAYTSTLNSLLVCNAAAA